MLHLYIQDADYMNAMQKYATDPVIVDIDPVALLKDHEKGIVLKIKFSVLNKSIKERFESLTNVEEKIEYFKNLKKYYQTLYNNY